MGSQRIHRGDVFAVPLPDGTYLLGRVMLDIYAATKKQLFPADSPLPGLGKAVLIEMYKQVRSSPEYVASDILIPGAFVEDDEIQRSWPVVANVPVDVCAVEFPEAMVGYMHNTGEVAFLRGEIRLPLPFTQRKMRAMGVFQSSRSAFVWPYTCLHELGRAREIPEEFKPTAHLRHSDLRYSKHRAKVYKYLPINPKHSYYQQQSQLGLNLERLYQ